MIPVYIGDFITTERFLFLMGWVIAGLTLFALFLTYAERIRRENQ